MSANSRLRLQRPEHPPARPPDRPRPRPHPPPVGTQPPAALGPHRHRCSLRPRFAARGLTEHHTVPRPERPGGRMALPRSGIASWTQVPRRAWSPRAERSGMRPAARLAASGPHAAKRGRGRHLEQPRELGRPFRHRAPPNRPANARSAPPGSAPTTGCRVPRAPPSPSALGPGRRVPPLGRRRAARWRHLCGQPSDDDVVELPRPQERPDRWHATGGHR